MYLSLLVGVEPDGPLAEHGLDGELVLDVRGLVEVGGDVELELVLEPVLLGVELLVLEGLVGGGEDGVRLIVVVISSQDLRETVRDVERSHQGDESAVRV